MGKSQQDWESESTKYEFQAYCLLAVQIWSNYLPSLKLHLLKEDINFSIED
jgi:hypothetical protein